MSAKIKPVNIITIKSIHATLAAAVAAANLDLFDDPKVAEQRIKDADTGTTRAFVTENDEVWYGFKTEDGINFLRKFEPFSPQKVEGTTYDIAIYAEDAEGGPTMIVVTNAHVRNNEESRPYLTLFCKENPNWFFT